MVHIKNKMQIIGTFSFACLLFCAMIRPLLHFSNLDILRFVFFQIMAVFLPGLAVASYIYKKGTVFEMVSFAYAIGYGINIMEYFLLYTLRLERFSAAFILIVAAASMYALVKTRDSMHYGNEKDEMALYLIFFGYILINILSISGNNLSPIYSRSGHMQVSRDLQFLCSNAVSLKNSFFPNATFFTDGTLYYHYFSSLYIGFMSRVTNIDVVSIAFILYPFVKCVLLIGGLNFLLNRFQTGSMKIFLMSIILFMSGKEWRSIVFYVGHVIAGSFACDLGFAFGCWYLATFILLIKEEKIDYKLLGINLLFWFICSGVKAPVAAVLIFVPFFFCCLWLIQRKYGKAFGYGGGIVGLFLLVSIICSGMLRVFTGASKANGDSFSIHLYSAGDDEYILRHPEYGRLYGLVDNVISKMYSAHPVLFIVTVINIIIFLVLIRKKKIEPKKITLALIMLIVTILGFVMGVVINAGGRSEMYFSMTAYLTGIVFNAVVIECGCTVIQIREYFFQNCFVRMGLACLGLYGVFLTMFVSSSGGLLKTLQSGYERGSEISGEYSFTKDETNACIWIKEHTDEDAVVMNDRSTVGGQDYLYYYGMFSERPQYLEATELLAYVELNNKEISLQDEIDKRMHLAERFYGNDMTAIAELKEAGVRYVIQNDQVTPGFLGEDGVLEETYVSGDITVYEII